MDGILPVAAFIFSECSNERCDVRDIKMIIKMERKGMEMATLQRFSS